MQGRGWIAAAVFLADRITNPVVGLLCTQAKLTDLCRDYCRVMILSAIPIMLQIAPTILGSSGPT